MDMNNFLAQMTKQASQATQAVSGGSNDRLTPKGGDIMRFTAQEPSRLVRILPPAGWIRDGDASETLGYGFRQVWMHYTSTDDKGTTTSKSAPIRMRLQPTGSHVEQLVAKWEDEGLFANNGQQYPTRIQTVYYLNVVNIVQDGTGAYVNEIDVMTQQPIVRVLQVTGTTFMAIMALFQDPLSIKQGAALGMADLNVGTAFQISKPKKDASSMNYSVVATSVAIPPIDPSIIDNYEDLSLFAPATEDSDPKWADTLDNLIHGRAGNATPIVATSNNMMAGAPVAPITQGQPMNPGVPVNTAQANQAQSQFKQAVAPQQTQMQTAQTVPVQTQQQQVVPQQMQQQAPVTDPFAGQAVQQTTAPVTPVTQTQTAPTTPVAPQQQQQQQVGAVDATVEDLSSTLEKIVNGTN